MKRFVILSIFLALLTAACGVTFPHIDEITPNQGLIGTQVSINGYGFGTTKDTHSIYFGGVTVPESNIISWNTGDIVLTVPDGAKSGNVFVKVKGIKSNSVYFNVLEFSPVPEDLISAVITDNPGMLSYIRSNPDKGFYLLNKKFILKNGKKEIHPEFVKIFDEIPFTFVSGWYDDNGSTRFVVKGFNRYVSGETESLETDGLIVDAVYHDGIIYACNYQSRSIEKINLKTWELESPFLTATDSPFEYPWKLYYSNADTSLILITRSIWAGESGRVIKYDLNGNQLSSAPLPPMKISDTDYVSKDLLLYGWNDDKPLVKVYPLFSSTETSYARYITYGTGFVNVGGFKIAPDNNSVIVSDIDKGTLLSFNNILDGGVEDVDNLITYGSPITDPTEIKTIRGIPYIFVKTGDSGISIIDTSIDAFYGTIDFKGTIKDFDYKFFDYR